MKVTAIGNRKGGVGKTAVTLGLATGLRLIGRTVLVIDLDSQANATMAMEGAGDFTIWDVLHGGEPGTLGQAIVSTPWGVDLVPSSEHLAKMESESMMAADHRLRTTAAGAEELQKYDHILIDLPPALGRLTLNGLIWADQVLAVTVPEAFSVSGVHHFLDTVSKVKAMQLNPDLKLAGIIVNGLAGRPTGEHSFQVAELEATYGSDMLKPYLPHRTAVQDSSSGRTPLTKLPGKGAAFMTEHFVAHARHLDKEN